MTSVSAKAIILEALGGVHGIVKDPAPEALVVDLAGSTVNIRARWWINPPRRMDVMQSMDQALQAMKEALTAEGIDLPFPTQQILLHDQTEATDGDRASQREGWPAGKQDVPRPRPIGGASARRSTSSTARGSSLPSGPTDDCDERLS
jgi:small conductance mechanosensitive channel